MELLLENWWKFSLMLLAMALALWIVGKAGDNAFVYFKEILVVLKEELGARTASRRAGGLNVLMLLIAGLLAFVASVPSIASSLGFLEEKNSNNYAPIYFLGFILLSWISTHYCRSAEKQSSAFSNKRKSKSKENTKPK